MIRVTPIGTCRIHTPLSRAVARYPIELDLRRNYGFVHTSDEALQQLRYLQGEKQFQPEVIPLVFRPGDADKTRHQEWEPSDLHIVEVSSAKRVRCGENAVQIVYLYRHFGDFFASNERARQFWNIVRGGHRGELLDFLARQPVYQMMSEEDRDLLTRLSTEQQTLKTIKSDMAEIVERLGREKVLFVTHVNAVTADGQTIPSRDRLVRWVKLAAQQLDAAVFDPTAAMEDFGQEQALENHGLDLAHYTWAFSDRMYDVLHQEHVAALFGAQAAGSEIDEQTREIASLAARLEGMIAGSDFFEGSRQLHSALERFPDREPLVHLRGLIRSRIGDFNGALADLSVGDWNVSLTESMRVALLEALNAAGDYSDVLAVADKLIGDEAANASIYRISANAAEQLGRVEVAADYAKQAYRMDRGDLSTALHALMLLTAAGNVADVDQWRREILENIASSSRGAFELCHWAVGHREEELFAAGLALVAATDKWSTIDLMEEALAAQLPQAIAASITVGVGLGRLAPGLDERRSAVIRGAIEFAQRLAEGKRVAQAYPVARALASLPIDAERQVQTPRLAGEGRRLIRELIGDVRDGIVEAQTADDPAAVVERGAIAGDILFEDAKSISLVARALQTLGEAQTGLNLLKKVSPNAGRDVNVRRLTARLAHAVRDYATALDMYGAIRAEGGPAAEKFGPEISRFFETAEPRSLKELTLRARAGKFDEALPLAHAITRAFGPIDRVTRELDRMHKTLRLKLRQIQEGEGDLDDREAILRRMLDVKPNDLSTLRQLALELMRQFRFAEAAEYWDRIHKLDPGNESADRNRVRCATLAQRKASASVQAIDITS